MWVIAIKNDKKIIYLLSTLQIRPLKNIGFLKNYVVNKNITMSY